MSHQITYEEVAMVKSKEWNWSEVTDNTWNEPSEDAYYYVNRWKEKGFKIFLDLGCGLGRHSILFAKNGYETYSLDLSQYGLDVLEKKGKELGLSIETNFGDISNLPYESNYFDCLFSYHVISHTDTVGIKIVVNEINRVLKNGGEFFVTICSKNSPNFTSKTYPKIDENTILKTEGPEVDVPHFYSDLEGVKEIFQEFDVIRIRHIEDFFMDKSSWHYFIHGKKR